MALGTFILGTFCMVLMGALGLLFSARALSLTSKHLFLDLLFGSVGLTIALVCGRLLSEVQ